VSTALVSATPAIAASTSGVAIAQHADFSFVSDSAAAKPGEFIILYLAGLGLADTPVATGAASPASPLAHPADRPAPTVNGSMVDIAFSGLPPSAVGLYQINFQVPNGLSDAIATSVVSQSGLASNTVTLPVSR
jgi:uncharacterized protein (TIGR03437 family)